MNGNDHVAMAAGELFGHGRSPVAAVRAEALVSELFSHEACPQIVDVKNHSIIDRKSAMSERMAL